MLAPVQTRDADPAVTARRMRRWLVTALSLILWGFGTHGTYAGSGDEPHYLAIAHSLAFDGDLNVRNNYAAAEPLIAGGNLVPESHVRETVDGSLRPVHDVGLPLLAVPVVRLAVPLVSWLAQHTPDRLMRAARLAPTTLYRHVRSLAMIACAALLGALMFDVLLLVGASPRAASATSLLLMVSPPLLAYSTLFFTELPSALLAFSVFVSLVWHPQAVSSRLAAGCATGLLLLVHVRNVGLVLGLMLVAGAVLRREGTRREAAAFAAGLAAMLALRTAINHHLWGTWITTPHASAGSWDGVLPAATQSALRLVALLVDQEYGLLPYGPVYLLALAGLPAFASRQPHVARPALLLVCSYLAFVLLPVTNVHGWSGQWCPAGRFLTPILPLVGLGTYFAIHSLPRAITALVLAVQIGLSAWFWQNPKLLWNDGDGRAAFCTRVSERVCDVLPSFARWVK